MSYELKLFRPVPGEDPQETRWNISASPNYKGPRNPETEERKRKIASALIEHDPNLQILPSNHTAIAKNTGLPLQEVERAFRAISLDPIKNTKGIHLRIDDDHVAIEVGYWHKGSEFLNVFQQLHAYLKLLSQNWGLVVHDPQIDRIITPDEIFSDSLREYSRGAYVFQPSVYGADIMNEIYKHWRHD